MHLALQSENKPAARSCQHIRTHTAVYTVGMSKACWVTNGAGYKLPHGTPDLLRLARYCSAGNYT